MTLFSHVVFSYIKLNCFIKVVFFDFAKKNLMLDIVHYYIEIPFECCDERVTLNKELSHRGSLHLLS